MGGWAWGGGVLGHTGRPGSERHRSRVSVGPGRQKRDQGARPAGRCAGPGQTRPASPAPLRAQGRPRGGRGGERQGVRAPGEDEGWASGGQRGPAGRAPGVPAPHAPHAEQKSVSTSVLLGLRQATNGPWCCIFSRQRFRKGGCWTPTDPAREDTRAPPGSHGWCVRATPPPGTRACRAHGRAAVPGQRALSPVAEGRVDHLLATEPS